MSADAPAHPPGFTKFRAQLVLAIMTVVSVVLVVAFLYAQRYVAENNRQTLDASFQRELAALHSVQAVRHAALAERCRALARKARIHAALEDGALDLLYPSARDELADIMEPANERGRFAFQARFYRFLDGNGAVIPPPEVRDVGVLQPAEEAWLARPGPAADVQTGYLVRTNGATPAIDEVIELPIHSTESGEKIAALAFGFQPFDPASHQAAANIKSGIWVDGTLILPGLSPSALALLTEQLQARLAMPDSLAMNFHATVDGLPSQLFFNPLNPGSRFPPAYEVILYPLDEARHLQRRLAVRFAGAWAVLLLAALVASHLLGRRLSQPVEKLAVTAEENRTQRQRAEAALERTHDELQRSAHFSADASHQLKTPVTVLRVGLEELLAGEKLSGDVREEVSALVHQTFRLTSVIEDLLLLSRMDAGRLELDLRDLDLAGLIAAALDDLSARPDDFALSVETDLPERLWIKGERRYTTLILQNLLENARKYNRPGGLIRLAARTEGSWSIVTLGNTGATIPAAAQSHIFERFHRGTIGENVPGHGLGLNLARQLAQLHHGDLRLLRSDDDWTEFEIRFPLAASQA